MNVQTVPLRSLAPPKWGTTYIMRPEKLLLRVSMLESGWLQPLVAKASDNTLIDGAKRWEMALSDEKFLMKYGHDVPVVFHEVDEIDAMMLHVRLNRAKGNVHPVGLSRMVKAVIASGKYSERDILNKLIMSNDELDLLLNHGLLKKKHWQEHEYSKAWIPVEVAGGAEQRPVIERPPNADR